MPRFSDVYGRMWKEVGLFGIYCTRTWYDDAEEGFLLHEMQHPNTDSFERGETSLLRVSQTS